MPMVLSYHDIDPSTVERAENRGPNHPANEAWFFFRAAANQPYYPTAFLVRMHSMGAAHWHGADEFQVVVEGSGTFGRHAIKAVTVHFARAYTAYGPLIPDEKTGWGFLTLRTRLNPSGTQRLPATMEKLKQIPNRKPWQASTAVSFDTQGFADVPELRDDNGLYAKTLKLAPGASAACPRPAGDGQYFVVTRGSLMHEGKEHRAITVVFLRNDEAAFTAKAGPEGLEALVLNLPTPVHEPVARLQTMVCRGCGFTYDQSLGLPRDSIREGTPWEEIPETWTCPDCGAAKSEFEELDS